MKALEPLFKLLTDRMPRKVAMSAVVMVATLLVFGALFFFLGGAHDDAFDRNESLKKNVAQTQRNARQAQDDRKFIVDNQELYEELLHGDRLVPHTRRVAISAIGSFFKQRGLDTMNYDISAAGDHGPAGAPAVVPVTGGYRLQVEKITLKLGAPLDTQVYDFLLDLGDSFPGSAVVEQFTLERAADVTSDMLNQVSRGQSSGLVHGEVTLTWRTAQAEEEKKPQAAGGTR